MSHKVEILSVGTELLLGSIANTDAQMLSQGLSALGLNVFWHTVVGDNPQRAREAVELARSRADIIITTGGLGPTCDDLTKNVLAEAFREKAGLSPGISGAYQGLCPGHRTSPDGKQLPAGPGPRGEHRSGQRLGLRSRLCLRGGRRPCHHAPRPPQ